MDKSQHTAKRPATSARHAKRIQEGCCDDANGYAASGKEGSDVSKPLANDGANGRATGGQKDLHDRKTPATDRKGRTPIDTRAMLYAVGIAVFLMAPFLYLDARKDRGQFVTVSWLPGSLAIDAAIIALLAAGLAAVLYLLLTRTNGFLERHAERNPLPRLQLGFDKRSIAVATGIIFCLWIPIMVLFYPCASNHDFINQVYQYQATGQTYYTTLGIVIDAEFIDHHPILDTLIYGWFVSLGDALGSQNTGMFIFSILQNLAVAATLGLSVCYLERLGLPKVLRIAALSFCVLFPFYSAFASAAMKDMLFVLGFTPFCICYLEAFRTKGAAFASKRFIAAFVLSCGICILTKKLGIYICAASLVVMVVNLKGARLRAAGALAASVLVFSVAFPAAVYPLIGGVAPGGRQESLCFALQQTTTLLKNKPEAVSEQDLEVIERVLDTQAAKENFKVALADGAKNEWRPEATSQDTLAYLKVWAVQGLHNPKEYILSCLQCCGQMLIPSKQLTFPVDISDASHFEKWGAHFSVVGEGYDIQLKRPESLLEASREWRSFILKGIGSIPVANLVTTIALYGAWIPFLCVAVSFFNRKGSIWALAPVMWSVCTLIISPGSLGRYVISLMFIMVPLIGWAIASFCEREGKQAASTEA